MIIDSTREFHEFLRRWESEDCFVEYVLCDQNRHAMNTSISLILVKFIEAGDVNVLPVNHNEAKSLPLDLFMMLRNASGSTKYVLDKKKIKLTYPLVGNVVDISICRYLMDGTLTDFELFYTKSHDQILSTYGEANNVHSAIPILKWVEWFEHVTADLMPYLVGETNKFYNSKVINTFAHIEQNGLKVNPELFIGNRQDIDANGLVYTQYNPYTSTGRPSNRFGGVNFAALPKDNGSRDAFISRFDNGRMVMFDYASYHPHLVAHMIRYDLPDSNVYEWLGRQYYDTDTLTKEQLDSAKEETFKQFYGGIDPTYARKIPYLRQIDKFVEKLWDRGHGKGYVTSPISGRQIHLDMIYDNTKYKLFNYLIQLYETEMNVLVMGRLINRLKEFETKMVLYTYDAFLFDVPYEEREDILPIIMKELDPAGSFPVRAYVGKTYGKMRQIQSGL